jgi:prepilin-type N-terminal cleavage/methylation domain-containing protein
VPLPAAGGLSAQRGLTVLEVLIGIAIMAIVGGAISILVGSALQAKMISSVRSSDTETARSTLEWMTERIRNAGLNLKPSAQAQLRCKDLVVAQDLSLLPTATSVYMSGEMLNTNTAAGDEDITLGYYLGSDPVTNATVVMEYNQACSGGATSIAANSKPLSSPKLTITGLSFQYFDTTGATVTNLTSAAQLRKIRVISVTLSVQGSEGRSGVQAVTLTRYVTFRNPEPNANNWVNVNENF